MKTKYKIVISIVFIISLIAFIILFIIKTCWIDSTTVSFFKDLSAALCLTCSLTINFSLNFKKTENNYNINFNNLINDQKLLDLFDIYRKCIDIYKEARNLYNIVINNFGSASIIFDKFQNKRTN